MVYPSTSQRQILERLLRNNIARLRSEIDSALRSTGSGEHVGLANHMNEVDDQAVADLETSLDIAMIERDLQELRASVQALRRLHLVGYGSCVDCRGTIGYQRLLANPAVTRCVDCQIQAERSEPRRPAL